VTQNINFESHNRPEEYSHRGCSML